MKDYIGKTPKFTKDQLVFVVDVMITASMDAIDVALDREIMVDQVSSFCTPILDKLSWDLSIFYAQITNTGIGCCDAIMLLDLEHFITKCSKNQKFRQSKTISTKMAKKFVNELFQDYLKD